MTKEKTRPLPNVQEPDTALFWQATKDQAFRYQQCGNCGTVVWHVRKHCTGCLDGELTWQTSNNQGRIYSYSVIRQSYHPFFRNLVPYVVAWVDLDEGPRFLTNVVGCDVEEVSVDMPVRITWEEHEKVNIPLVEPLI